MSDDHLLPKTDEYERAKFLRRVRPADWKNPKPSSRYDLAIVGGGPAGLAAADSAIRLGLKVALIERNRLGGNSLNVGSVPSKAIIRTARFYAAMREAGELGAVVSKGPPVDFSFVMARLRRIRARIAEYNSVDRLQAKGIDIFFGDARFADAKSLIVDDTRLHFRKALVATGARPRSSNIPGLDQIGYRTSTTIFDLTALPERLAIIGGGPLGCELAQAFCRLGSRVTIVQNEPKFLPREARDAADLLSQSLARDGVEIRLNTTVTGAHIENGTKFLDTVNNEVKDRIAVDDILLSIGRVPSVDALDLQMAGIEFGSDQGIRADDFLRTTNTNVYAAGDVCMEHKFTNVAEASARMAVHNAVLGARKRRSHLMIPWCTFCDPEIGHVGMHAWEARQQSISVKSYTIMMQDVDRAITDSQDGGFVKIHVREGTDRIIGATVVASRASEMINEISVIMSAGIGMRDLAKVLHTYPAQSEAIKMAAMAYNSDRPVSWLKRAYARFCV